MQILSNLNSKEKKRMNHHLRSRVVGIISIVLVTCALGMPAFFNLGGGSFGAQIGADKTDYVLLVMNEDGLKGLLGDKFEIGGEVGVAAGPVGREASAATDAQLQAEILTYSRSKGLFAGVALKGTAITPDNNLNEAFYGLKARDVLNGAVARIPPPVSIFPET